MLPPPSDSDQPFGPVTVGAGCRLGASTGSSLRRPAGTSGTGRPGSHWPCNFQGWLCCKHARKWMVCAYCVHQDGRALQALRTISLSVTAANSEALSDGAHTPGSAMQQLRASSPGCCHSRVAAARAGARIGMAGMCLGLAMHDVDHVHVVACRTGALLSGTWVVCRSGRRGAPAGKWLQSARPAPWLGAPCALALSSRQSLMLVLTGDSGTTGGLEWWKQRLRPGILTTIEWHIYGIGMSRHGNNHALTNPQVRVVGPPISRWCDLWCMYNAVCGFHHASDSRGWELTSNRGFGKAVLLAPPPNGVATTANRSGRCSGTPWLPALWPCGHMNVAGRGRAS
jgi:hypothetical protein